VHFFSEGTAAGLCAFLGWFLFFYWYHGVGITLGYHRLLTHKSFKLNRWLAYFMVTGGYFCLMGAPITWVGVHRLHHQKSDLEGDPHSPRDGFLHSLYEWMFDMKRYQSNEELLRQTPDLMTDPFYRALGYKHEAPVAVLCLALNILFRVFIFCAFGWIALAANLFAMGFVFLSTQLVNAVCHYPHAGYRLWDTRDDSLNVWWVGILAVGEGWHNNHHAVPKSAKHGMAWWEIDVTWMTIWVFEKLGLAREVIRPPKLPAKLGTRTKLEELMHLETPKEAAVEP
jgi:sn-1 stearoyl-lipid 9-desaturase